MMHKANGFSVVEVLVAITLMAVSLTGIASMGVSTIGADTYSRGISAATSLAQAKLEELRLLPRSHADWQGGEEDVNEDGLVGDTNTYTRAWTVTANYNGYTRLSRVTVTVSWYQRGEERSVELASLFY